MGVLLTEKNGGLQGRQGHQFCMPVDGSWRPDQRDVEVLGESKASRLSDHGIFLSTSPIKGHNGLRTV